MYISTQAVPSTKAPMHFVMLVGLNWNVTALCGDRFQFTSLKWSWQILDLCLYSTLVLCLCSFTLCCADSCEPWY